MVIARLRSAVPTVAALVACAIGAVNLVAWRDLIYAIPQKLGGIDLEAADLGRYPDIKTYPTHDAARRALAPG